MDKVALGNKTHEIVILGRRKLYVFGEKYKIYQVIRQRKVVKASELREFTDVNHNSIKSALHNLTHEGLIERTDRGTYKLTEKH